MILAAVKEILGPGDSTFESNSQQLFVGPFQLFFWPQAALICFDIFYIFFRSLANTFDRLPTLS